MKVRLIIKNLLGLFTLLIFMQASSRDAHAVVEKWGSHLKDSPGMIPTVRQAYLNLGGNPDNWYPFDIMLPGAGTTGEVASIRADWQNMLNTARANRMLPVIRVTSKLCTGGWEKLDIAYAGPTAQMINGLNASGFPDLIYIEWGNEVNLGREWGNDVPDPAEYQASYSAFKSAMTNSAFGEMIAGMNTSNPDINPPQPPAMDAVRFYQGMSDTTGSALPSHPFQTNVSPEPRYTIMAWQFDQQYAMTDAPILITGGGLSPSYSFSGGNRATIQERAQYLAESFRGNSYQGVPPLGANPVIKYITADLQDDPSDGTGTDQFFVQVYGPNGTTMIPLSGGGSRGGGQCLPPQLDLNTGVLSPACLNPQNVPDDDPNQDVANLRGTLEGDVIIRYIDDYGKERVGNPAGMIIAWVEKFIDARDNTDPDVDHNITYHQTIVSPDGRFNMTPLNNNGSVFLEVICGDKVLDTLNLEMNGETTAKTRLVYNENLNCAGSNPCLRMKANGRINADICQRVLTPEQYRIVPLRGTTFVGEDIQRIGWDCILNALSCLEDAGQAAGQAIRRAVFSTRKNETKEVLATGDARWEAISAGYGITPRVDEPSCDTIRTLNEKSSLIRNLGRGGRSRILGMSPSTFKVQAQLLKELHGAKVICDHRPLREFCYQGEENCTGMDPKFWPYYYMAQLNELNPPGFDGITELHTNPQVYATGGGTIEDPYVCGGVYEFPGGVGNPPECRFEREGNDDPSREEDTSTWGTMRGGQDLSMSAGLTSSFAVRCQYSPPGSDCNLPLSTIPSNSTDANPLRNVFEEDPASRASNVKISRVRELWKECPCNIENGEYSQEHDEGFRCKEGGVKWAVTVQTVVDDFLTNFFANRCTDENGVVDPACPFCANNPLSCEATMQPSSETQIDITLPLSKKYGIYTPVSAKLRRPGQLPPQYEGALGTTSGSVNGRRSPYEDQDKAFGSVGKAKECIYSMFCTPKNGQGCGYGSCATSEPMEE